MVVGWAPRWTGHTERTSLLTLGAATAKAKEARDKAVEAAENVGVEPLDLNPLAADAMPRRGLARKADGTPTRKTQRNFTDPESHLMQSGGSYLQGYNCQLAVDTDHQVIVAVGVSNQPPDVEHLEPMRERIVASAGGLPDVMTMDAGYWSEDNVQVCADQGIDAYIATGRLPHGQQAEKQEGICDLRPTQGHRGASERADQGRPRPAALPVAGPGQG